jgi:hypothetical protein
MPFYCEKTGGPSPNGGSCDCQGCYANRRIEALEAALRELASCDGSSDNVANAEVLARRVRAIARAALAPEQRK